MSLVIECATHGVAHTQEASCVPVGTGDDRATIEDVWHRLNTLEKKVDQVIEISERVEKLAVTVAGHVKPVLDDLMKSPLLKMLGVKK